MIHVDFGAPGRMRLRTGALLVFAAAAWLGGCDKKDGPSADPHVLELAHDTIRLDNGRVIQIFMHAAGDSAGFRPANVRASVGDVLRFTAGDAMTHAVAFEAASLSAEARAFLERTSQMRSPPLVDRGTAWVVSLEGAPPGTYPFIDLTHQSRGQMTVKAASQ
jgi:plastocyanin